jgi:hypothetical protein
LITKVAQVFRNILKRHGVNKSTKTIDSLGCSAKEFYEHIQTKMDKYNTQHTNERMTFQNIAIDHIRPASIFALDEVGLATHYTNLQPLLIKHNTCKNNKWNDEDEAYWRAYIIHNPSYKQIYWPKACHAMH